MTESRNVGPPRLAAQGRPGRQPREARPLLLLNTQHAVPRREPPRALTGIQLVPAIEVETKSAPALRLGCGPQVMRFRKNRITCGPRYMKNIPAACSVKPLH